MQYLDDVDERKKESAAQLAAEQAARRAANAKPGLSKPSASPVPAAPASQNGNGACSSAAESSNGNGAQGAGSSNGSGARLKEVQRPAAKEKQPKMLKLGFREQQVRPKR